MEALLPTRINIMHADLPRFECLPEPTGTWMVWDNRRNRLATLDSLPLGGRQKDRARAACAVLASIYRSRLDACAVRQDALYVPAVAVVIDPGASWYSLNEVVNA